MKILMLAYSGGFEHSYLPHAEVAIKKLGQKHGWPVTTTRRCELINEETLSDVDVLVMATTGSPPLDAQQKKLFLDFVRGGKGLLGIHNATDSFYDWPEYGEMLGGYFQGHPWTQKVEVIVEEPDHPATRMLNETFTVYDEIYTFKNFDREKTNVLMRLNNESVDLSRGNRDDHDYALGWYHSYGQGRVIYTALGHPDDLWEKDWFLEHITGCLQWAGGLAD